MLSASGMRLTVSLGNPDAVYAALRAVLDLHERHQVDPNLIASAPVHCAECGVVFPCATIQAVGRHIDLGDR